MRLEKVLRGLPWIATCDRLSRDTNMLEKSRSHFGFFLWRSTNGVVLRTNGEFEWSRCSSSYAPLAMQIRYDERCSGKYVAECLVSPTQK